MKAILALMFVVLGIGVARAGDVAAGNGDLSRLQGRWCARAGARRELAVALEVRGQDIKVAIRTPQGLDIKVRGGLKLNEAASPRNLDWVKLSGPGEQPLPEISGIYKLEGDIFTVCNGGFLGARPTDFKGGDGPLSDVVVFTRAKSESPTKDLAAGGQSAATAFVPHPQAGPRSELHERSTK